jgi:D-glycero-D-manno-heptose 1,7-bisphosphate phosphatase
MNKAIFIDKDGTLIHDVPYNVNPDRIVLYTGTIQALASLKELGYLVIVISNQSGVARGYFEEHALEAVKERLGILLGDVGIDGFYYCPHHPHGTVERYTVECDCRKPQPGMILQAAKDFQVDLSQSWMIGDILSDAEAGNRAGCKTILINNGNETEWEMNSLRKPAYIVKDLVEASQLIQEYTWQQR